MSLVGFVAAAHVSFTARKVMDLENKTFSITPLKTNMTLKNHNFQQEIHLQKWWIFYCQCEFWRGVKDVILFQTCIPKENQSLSLSPKNEQIP